MYKRILIVLITILSIQLNVGAQANKYQWQNMKGDGAGYQTVANDPMGVRYYKLENGLTVILSVNKETPRIQSLIAVKAGSKTDPSDHTGLAHYLEHMLFKGTDQYGSLNWTEEQKHLQTIDNLYEQYNQEKDEAKRKIIYQNIDSVSGVAAKFAIANEYDKMMSGIGAKGTNAFTSFEQTVYVNDIPSNQFDKWLKIEGERFRKPVFRIFHTELEAVYEEKNRSLDSDGDKVFESLFESLFKKHNYGLQTTIGTIEHLKNPSLVEIRNYFYKNYVPNNMAIILVGDLDPNATIAKVKAAFGGMKAKEIKPYTFQPEDEITSPIIKNIYGPDAESVTMAYRFPGAKSKDATLLSLMSSILSNGNAGLMDLNLVKKQTVFKKLLPGAEILEDYSVLYFDGKAKEGQPLEEVKDALLSQIELLKTGNFDEKLLKAIINNYKKSILQRNESNAGRAYTILDAFTTNTSWLDACKELDEMSQLTKQDIVTFSKKYFKENYVCIYKRMGKDENIVKVDKPTITPVEVNRDAQSNFVKDVLTMPGKNMTPVYVDYTKDIAKSKIKDIEVLSVKNTINNLYTLYYYVEMGKWHNKLLPLAVDYLQFLGTDKLNADAISKTFYQTASDFGVSSSNEETYVFLNGLHENFTNDVKQFEYLLANCKPNEAALADMIAGVKKKRADAKLNKGSIRQALTSYAKYGADNPFNYNLSDQELDAITPQQLIEILHQLTSYKHKVLYYGPYTNAQLNASIKTLHITPASLKPIPPVHKFNYSTSTANKVLFTDYDMVQSELTWLRNGEIYNEAQLPVINLFNEYFGGSMSGVVFQDIRESKALAYSTFANYQIPLKTKEPYSVLGYVGCQSDKMKESIDAMNSLLNKLPKSEKMLEQAKSAITTNISTTRITKAAILFNYLNALKKETSTDIRKNTFDKVPALGFNEVDNFFTNNIANKNFTLCVVANEKKINMPELEKFGAVTKLDLKTIFGY